MRSFAAFRWILVVVVFLAIIIWIIPGSDKHYVDVYIGSDGNLYTHAMGPQAIDPMFVVPGDYVAWNNLTDQEANLTFEDPDWFGVATAKVGPYERLILKFHGGVDGSTTIDVGPGMGSPDLKVGDGP